MTNNKQNNERETMKITYLDGNYEEVTINVETASLDELSDAYSYLLDMGYTDDFPGSAGWKAAKVFSDQLHALIKAWPEVEQYRKDQADAKRKERLAGKDVLGM